MLICVSFRGGRSGAQAKTPPPPQVTVAGPGRPDSGRRGKLIAISQTTPCCFLANMCRAPCNRLYAVFDHCSAKTRIGLQLHVLGQELLLYMSPRHAPGL